MELDRKEFHFDLDIKLLKDVYPSKHENAWKSAWSDIKNLMMRNGFDHQQYSGYESIGRMSYQNAYFVIDTLISEYPWLTDCVKAATFTEIGQRYNLTEELKTKGSVSNDVPFSRDTRKEIHFDLSIEALKRSYSPLSAHAWKKAWSDIRLFLESQGFIHTQYSGYESSVNLSMDSICLTLNSLISELPWFPEAVKIATVTEIGDRHDALAYIKEQHPVVAPTPIMTPNRTQQVSCLRVEANMAKMASKALERNQLTCSMHATDRESR
ncbi:hypothetical protein [[Ruminococcus] torques]|uniref:Uncharacterized protein n=1 Tax=[Ruminococcus] torques TaxID=33039 RepID=A0A4Q5C2W0_9FIRM|nr:hypothetical protein [[Ruminococcus] torques]MTQ70169.1 hypothetical protein [[Ruminococcus] torques]MTQ74536.1 hypothetical protein [[Ruminococcus] torques]MTQ78962.1 hypothetical protein [[Ruminococcus] torques]MTQ85193.1 hypothetical protein [[Ruminococcus] torques]MTR59752.1 hypothetical protein [[Ruminococcus] torques]